MTPHSLTDLIERLSSDAKCVAGAWFGMMTPGKGDLTFQLQTTRPTDRALDALAELVAGGFVSVEALNRYGGLVYRPLVDCRWGYDFLREHENDPAIKWPITQTITGGDREARDVLRRALRARTPDEKDQTNGA
jgi:hypothetical protein